MKNPTSVFSPKSVIIKATPKPTRPKMVLSNATIRQRIEVSINDLKDYHTDWSIINAAKNIITSANIEDMNYVLNLGIDVQKESSDLALRLFEFSNNETLKASKVLLSDLIRVLEQISSTGWIAKIKKFASNNIHVNFQHYTSELVLKVSDLEVLQVKLKTLELDFSKTLLKLEPYIIALSYLIDKKSTELIVSRLTSLLNNKQTLQQNQSQIKSIEESVIKLIDSINNIILVEVPSWLSNSTSRNQQIIQTLKTL